MHKIIFPLIVLSFLLRPISLEAQTTNSIAGQLFIDLNDDGLYNDPPVVGNVLENIEIHLLDTNGLVVDIQFTDLAGTYLFPNLLPDAYQVYLPQLPGGHFLSIPGGDSFLEPIPRLSDPLTLDGIIIPPLIVGGLVPGNPIEIKGFVWDDQNNNGIQDLGELPFPNFEIKLEAPGFAPELIITGINGEYEFPFLPSGPIYGLEGILPPQVGIFSPPNQGIDDNIDSDVNPFGQLIIPTNPYPGPILVFDVGVKKPIKIKVVSILSGALRSNGQMGTELNDNGLLPIVEPYTGLGYGLDNPGINMLPGNVPDAVDWVTIELRDKNDSTVVLASKSAIIKKDGCVVDAATGQALCFEGLINDSYFIALRHRNHLDIMTNYPVFLDDQVFTVDFTDPNTPTVGIDAQKTLPNGEFGLWGGDANGDNELKFSGINRDPQAILGIIGGADPTQQTAAGYYLEDTNLDGVSKYSGPNRDPQIILESIGGTDPTQTQKSNLPD
ncbi:MAG: SdrD B-like domain-containing protein [Bacteroidia bacterium]